MQALSYKHIGSVPRSLEDPITTNGTNIDGFLNMLVAARDAAVELAPTLRVGVSSSLPPAF